MTAIPPTPTEPQAQLHLGPDSGWVQLDTAQGQQTLPLALGTDGLARRFFPGHRLGPLAVEQAIAAVEDVVMPLRAQLPSPLHGVTTDPALHALALLAGADPGPGTRLGLEALEGLFNRWVALVEGRPATQDALPTSAEFAATLLVLRECMHHLPITSIALQRDSALGSARTVTSQTHFGP